MEGERLLDVTDNSCLMLQPQLRENGPTEWTAVTQCSATCNGGSLEQRRICLKNTSAGCVGDSARRVPCNEKPCPGVHVGSLPYMVLGLGVVP
jgi:hypothetical protein